MPCRRAAIRVVFALALLLPGGPLAAQLPPLTVPRGSVRVDGSGGFAVHDRRFRDGIREDAAADFIHDPAGRSLFPALATADSLLARITGMADAALTLGSTRASQLVFIGTGAVGLAWGVTSRLTLFGTMPIERVRVRATFELDSLGSTTGLNPANPLFGTAVGQAQAGQFFQQFDAALAALADRLANGVYDGDPAQRALAQETLTRGEALRGELFLLLGGGGTASLFLPTAASVMGGQVRSVITTLQTTFGTLGVQGFSEMVPLPERRAGTADVVNVLQRGDGPFRGSLETPRLATLGDIELGAAFGLVDTYRPETRRGARLAAQGLVRLRTSQRARPGWFFEVGSGDRQPDVEGTLVGDLLLNRVGLRLLGGYTLQLPGQALMRIAPPSEPFPEEGRLAAVDYDLGDVLTLGAQPYLRLAPHFGLTGGVTWRRRAADVYTLVPGQEEIPGAPVALLGEESERTWTTAHAGFSYSAGRFGGRPLDAGMWWEGVVASTGGRVPMTSAVRFLLRAYHRFGR
jgi:hypothetical protein